MGRHNVPPLDTRAQMGLVVEGMVGKRLTYDELTATEPKLAIPASDPF